MVIYFILLVKCINKTTIKISITFVLISIFTAYYQTVTNPTNSNFINLKIERPNNLSKIYWDKDNEEFNRQVLLNNTENDYRIFSSAFTYYLTGHNCEITNEYKLTALNIIENSKCLVKHHNQCNSCKINK